MGTDSQGTSIDIDQAIDLVFGLTLFNDCVPAEVGF
jgi:hypothetical protein